MNIIYHTKAKMDSQHIFIIQKALIAIFQFQSVITAVGLTLQSICVNITSRTVRFKVLAPYPSTIKTIVTLRL